jgi:uncharacterized membrane protein YdjX (TVP38/TMEM64 family)
MRRAAVRFAVLVVLLGGSFAAVRWTPLGELLEAERLQATLAHLRGAWWSPLVHLALFLVFGAIGVPATPFLLAGAAIFGFAWGMLWNWLGVVGASVAGFLLAKALGREFVERLGGDKVKRAETVLHRRGFLPLVAIRFLPIPFSLVNASAAVVGVRLPKFVAATALGVAPPVVILTYFASALLAAATGERGAIAGQLAIVSASMVLLVFLPIGIRRRLRHNRLRRLRGERAARPRRR